MTDMSVPILFDQQLIRQHRQRAAPSYSDFAFLKNAAAGRLADRLELIRRNFDLCLDVGAHDGRLAQHFARLGKIGLMIHTDPAEKFAIANKKHGPGVVHALAELPFKPESFDFAGPPVVETGWTVVGQPSWRQ